MNTAYIAPISTFAQAVATGRPDVFDPAVQAAYASGATHADLLAAVEHVRREGAVPEFVVTQAYLTVYSWSGLSMRRAA